jgi:outer membrane protein TolC
MKPGSQKAVGPLLGCLLVLSSTSPTICADEIVLYPEPIHRVPQSTYPAGLTRIPAKAEIAADELVRQVLERNPSLAQMAAAWEAARARYPQVISLEDPMLGTMFAPASIGSNTLDFGYRVEVSQRFPFPGKRGLRGEGALADAQAAGLDVDDIRLQLAESARMAFYDYYLVHRAITVNEEGLKLLRELRDSAESRYKASLVTQQDVWQADVEIGKQRERRLTLERTKKVAAARINTLLHLAPDTPIPPPPEKLALPAAPPPVQSLRERAVARRPDLQALAARLASDQAALSLALREYYPDFEATVAYDTIMGNGPGRDLAPQIGLRLNLPCRRARRNAAVAEAQAKLAQRHAELASRTDQIHFQVQEAFEQVLESEKIVRLYERTILPAARGSVEAGRSAYQAGKIPFLSLIEAQRNLVMIRDRSYEAIADYFRRRATLERVTGGPLDEPRAGRPEAPK